MRNKQKRDKVQRDEAEQNTGSQGAGKKLEGSVFALEREGALLSNEVDFWLNSV